MHRDQFLCNPPFKGKLGPRTQKDCPRSFRASSYTNPGYSLRFWGEANFLTLMQSVHLTFRELEGDASEAGMQS